MTLHRVLRNNECMTTKPRLIRSPLYRFADEEGDTYTAEGERRSDSDVIKVTVHLGYPREHVIGTAQALRVEGWRVEDVIMGTARAILDASH